MKQLLSFLIIVSLLVGCGTTNIPQGALDQTAPAVPVWTVLTPGDAQVRLEWQANSEEDLDHYKLYWRANSSELSKEETLDKNTTSFIVSSLSNGIAHFFALTAVDTNGNTSAMSTEMMATPEALAEPPPPDDPEEGSFGVSTLESITIQKGQAKALPFAIARNNYEADISFNLINAPEGVSSDLPQSTAKNSLVVTLSVASKEEVIAGDYVLKFEASAEGLTKTVSLTLIVEDAPEAPELPPADGDFSVAVKTISDPVMFDGDHARLDFIFVRDNFPETIKLALKSAPDPISSNLPANIDDNEFKVNLLASDELAAGVYELEFEASAAGMSKTVLINVKVEAKAVPVAPGPEVLSLHIEGNEASSRQLRQGYQNFVFAIEGKHLADITAAYLEKDNAVAITTLSTEPIELGIENHTDDGMNLVGSIPSGQAQGFYKLVFKTTKHVNANEAIIVTPVTASPSGDDAAGRGTPDEPYRSLSKAVSVAGAGDRIELKDGSYNVANGEQFPIDVSGLMIVGESRSGTLLNGFGAAGDCIQIISHGAEIHNMTIRECGQEGIQATTGSSNLMNVEVTQNGGHGMHVYNSAQITIVKSAFSKNAGSGIMAQDNAKLSLSGTSGSQVYTNGSGGIHLLENAQLEGRKLYAGGNQIGLWVAGKKTQVDLEASVMFGNSMHGVRVVDSQKVILRDTGVNLNTISGLDMIGSANVDFIDGKAYGNGSSGIHVFVEDNEVAVLNVTDSVIDQNGARGIEFHSEDKGSTLFMRDSKIKGNASQGLYISGKPSFIDLGMALDPGNNMLSDNGGIYLEDARDADSGGIIALSTDFAKDGILFDAKLLRQGPAQEAGIGVIYWKIVNEGNQINFGF